jgi:hypothetical protein
MRLHDLAVETVSLDAISQHPGNANNGDVEALEQSIDVNGFYQPLIVQRSTGHIIAGNHRYLVAHKMGATEVPVIYLDVDDEAAVRMMLADNRITRLGFDDESQLFDRLDELHDTDLGLLGTGFDNRDLQHLLDLATDPLKFDDVKLPDDDDDVQPLDSAKKPSLGYSVMPTVNDDDRVYEIVLAKPGFTHMTRRDLNRIRKALGAPPLSDEEIDSYGVQGW